MLDQVNEIEKEIEREVSFVCINLFPKGLFHEARNTLYKLYNKYYRKLTNIDVKRDLLYRLIVAESNCDNDVAVCEYTLLLKKDMDATPDYSQTNIKEYCDMLSYYCGNSYIDLTKDEKIKCYCMCVEYYRDLLAAEYSIDTYLRLLNTEFNIKRVDEDLEGMLDLVEKVSKVEYEMKEHYINQMNKDIVALNLKSRHIS